jgi:hypothetical protein
MLPKESLQLADHAVEQILRIAAERPLLAYQGKYEPLPCETD